MTRELVDRMRTCAAAIRVSQQTGDPWNTSGIIAADAMNLLEEAAAELGRLSGPESDLEPLGEPMEALPAPPPQTTSGVGKPVWGGIPVSIESHPCPTCGSVDARTVTRIGRGQMQLTCPVCKHHWEYGA